METIIVYNNNYYTCNFDVDVFSLRDNFNTEVLVKALVSALKQISADTVAGKRIFKFENNKWYFWEADFSCWEDSTTYHPCPELAPEVQAKYMKELNT